VQPVTTKNRPTTNTLTSKLPIFPTDMHFPLD
jgi:hypothetical protein